MFKKTEIALIIIISIIIAFAITLVKTPEIFAYVLLSIFLVIIINTIAKKITAYYADSEAEVKIWQMERWGLAGILTAGGYFHPSKEFKHPFPLGAFLPIITKVLLMPLTNFVWMACLIFDVKTKVYKSAKRHNITYGFSEITDYQIGLIAASGIIANLVFAFIFYLIGIPEQMNFARLSIIYAFFNMLPLSNLDGNKIYFGNAKMWFFLEALTLGALGYALFLP